MCDCYGHQCDHSGCKAVIPMHLEDYATARREVRVYCGKHAGRHTGGTAYEYSDDDDAISAEYVRHWATCRVVPRTANAREHASGNHPNAEWLRPAQNKGA